MLIAGISYVFYQRDIESKRLLTSIGVGIITAIILIMLQLLFSLITSNLSYSSLIKELARTGVNWKWQMFSNFTFCHSMSRVIYENCFTKRINTFFNTEMGSYINNCNLFSSLFIYLDNWWIVTFIFVAQVILSLSYEYTRRIATTSVAQIVAIILLLIFNA